MIYIFKCQFCSYRFSRVGPGNGGSPACPRCGGVNMLRECGTNRREKGAEKMKYNDWERLDDLLNEEGFGGYYDFLELLKSYIRHWYRDKFGTDGVQEVEREIEKVKTLHQATCMLTAIELMEVKK